MSIFYSSHSLKLAIYIKYPLMVHDFLFLLGGCRLFFTAYGLTSCFAQSVWKQISANVLMQWSTKRASTPVLLETRHARLFELDEKSIQTIKPDYIRTTPLSTGLHPDYTPGLHPDYTPGLHPDDIRTTRTTSGLHGLHPDYTDYIRTTPPDYIRTTRTTPGLHT